jgi:hypothetical protein
MATKVRENQEIALLREVVKKLTQLLAGRGIRVTQRGASAFVEYDKNSKPVSVNIPYIPDDASAELILAIQGFIDHEVAHLLHSNFDLLTKGHELKVANLHNIVEDTFVERAIVKTFPGSAHNLKRLHEFFLKNITEPALAKVGADEQAQFGVILVPAMRALSGQGVFNDWMTNNGHWDQPLMKKLIDKMTAEDIAALPKLASTQETLDLALRLNAILHPPAPPPPPPPAPPAEEEDEDEDDSDDESDDSEEKAPEGSDSRDHDEDDDSTGGEEGEEDDDTSDDEDSVSDDAEDEDGADDEDDDADDEDGESEHDEDSDSDEDDSDGDSSEDEDDEDADEDEDDADTEDDGEAEDPSDDTTSESGEDSDDPSDEDEAEDASEESGDDATGGGDIAPEKSSGEEEGEVEADEEDSESGDEVTFNDLLNPLWKPGEFDGALADKIAADTKEALSSSEYAIYTTDFDVIEPAPDSGRYKPQNLEVMEDKTRHMVGVMQKEIERLLAARSQTVHVPGFRSGRMHSASLHRLQTSDDRIFRRRHQSSSKKTAISLLVDNSGSMGSGEKSKTAIAMEAAYALSSTLERIGLNHEVIGFTTTDDDAEKMYRMIQAEEDKTGVRFSRWEPIYMPVYKDFKERLTPAVKKRFADVAYNGNFFRSNVDGECVRIAALRLMKQTADRHILIVLSDGQPAFHSGNTGWGTPKNHLMQTMEWLEKTPVEAIGIGIKSNAVASYYKKHMVIDNIASLPKVIMEQLRHILLD